MSGGSVYDYLHKQKGVFKLPTLLKVAIDVSKGMNYLHQNNIIHRDLKAANLLMDENEVRCSIKHTFSIMSISVICYSLSVVCVWHVLYKLVWSVKFMIQPLSQPENVRNVKFYP